MIKIRNYFYFVDPSYNDEMSDVETDEEDNVDEPHSGQLSQNKQNPTREEHQKEGQPIEEWEEEDDRSDDDDGDDEPAQSYPASKSTSASGRKGIRSTRFTVRRPFSIISWVIEYCQTYVNMDFK